jgi:hypothetical protein
MTSAIAPQYDVSATATIWRYMDMPKFLALLQSSSLVFPIASSFDDPSEGHYTRPTEDVLRQAILDQDPQALTVWHKQLQMRDEIYVSCWHLNDHESAAMWRIFLKGSDGVSIRSSVGHLWRSLNETNLVFQSGAVTYIDFDNSLTHTSGPGLLLYKRLDFQHEREFRIMVWGKGPTNMRFLGSTLRHVLSLPVNLSTLIHEVVVSPEAPAWVLPVLKDLISKYGYSLPVRQSAVNTWTPSPVPI